MLTDHIAPSTVIPPYAPVTANTQLSKLFIPHHVSMHLDRCGDLLLRLLVALRHHALLVVAEEAHGVLRRVALDPAPATQVCSEGEHEVIRTAPHLYSR